MGGLYPPLAEVETGNQVVTHHALEELGNDSQLWASEAVQVLPVLQLQPYSTTKPPKRS